MIIIKLALENAAILSMVHKIWDRLVEGCFFLIVRLCAKRIPAAHIFSFYCRVVCSSCRSTQHERSSRLRIDNLVSGG